MIRNALLFTVALAACAPTAPAPQPAARVIPSGPEPDQIEWGYNRAVIERDLLTTARARLGEATVRRALAADAYLFAKSYAGMLPPPPPNAGPDWHYPVPPFTLLFHEGQGWLVATKDGARPAQPAAITEIRALLSDPLFWRQPDWAGPGCTDAGASLLMLKLPGRPESVRRGACGDTELTERLVQLAHRAAG